MENDVFVLIIKNQMDFLKNNIFLLSFIDAIFETVEIHELYSILDGFNG